PLKLLGGMFRGRIFYRGGSFSFRRCRVNYIPAVTYMNELLHQLFRLAQLNDPSQAFQKSKGYIDSLLQTVIADYILILNDKGIKWHVDLPKLSPYNCVKMLYSQK